MNKKYRVVFLGLVESEEDFKQGLFRLGISPATTEQIIHKAPVVLKEGMTLGDARHYADAIQYAGGKVNIKEHGLLEEERRIDKSLNIKTFENFTMCPECVYKQLKAEACVKCGLPLKEGETGREL